jgi:hypothetical protein
MDKTIVNKEFFRLKDKIYPFYFQKFFGWCFLISWDYSIIFVCFYFKIDLEQIFW